MTALGAKSYCGHNYETNELKKGSKGIPHAIKLEVETFKNVLYEHCSHQFKLGTLRLSKEKKMCRYSSLKVGLTDLYVKHQLDSDRITCSPLRVNGKLL